MKVKELIEELQCYDEDMEVKFEIDDDIQTESLTLDKNTFPTVHVDEELKVTFSCESCGCCTFTLEVDK